MDPQNFEGAYIQTIVIFPLGNFEIKALVGKEEIWHRSTKERWFDLYMLVPSSRYLKIVKQLIVPEIVSRIEMG